MTAHVNTPSSPASHWPDIGEAKKPLGYYPKVSTEEGSRKLAEAVKGGFLKVSRGGGLGPHDACLKVVTGYKKRPSSRT